MSSKSILPSCAASESEDGLKITISDWLQKIRLSQYHHIARNLDAYGVFLVEDFEHLKKEVLARAIEISY